MILEDELKKMLKKNFISVITREHTIGFVGKRIDRNFLIENISDFSQQFYVCGPDDFVQQINKHLLSLGAQAEMMVFEQ